MMKIFNINDIPEFSQKERIVVVGVIGKSSYRYPNKATPLVPSVDTKENGIECHWDERRAILYLHAVTYLDASQLLKLAENLDENSKTAQKDADAAHWLVASGGLAMESCKIMGLIFNLCHIVVLSSPTPVFDIGYLQLFKAIDSYRFELTPQITAALTEVGAGGAWESHGRLCCPRLLFHFQQGPTALKRNLTGLKKLEHAVEDQLYYILRKARMITNVCAKSLFAIPKNEEFVYINTERSSSARDVSALVRGLVQSCAGAAPEPTNDRPGFAQFVQGHVDQAFTEGFNDNFMKYAMSISFFELPSASRWRLAAETLVPIYLQESDEEQPGPLYDALATDVRFSEARCAKVLPIAQASYAEGLPSHFSSQHHAHKLSMAMSILNAMARGPLADNARSRLRSACTATWRARTLCEAPSLTGHLCVCVQHDNSKEHSSGVRYISACNCGRTKCSREDPYSVKKANYTFYVQAAEECGVCNTLQAIEFPVFQPSTPTFRAASVKGASSQDNEHSTRALSTSDASDDWSAPDVLSPGESDDGSDDKSHRDKDGVKIVTVQASGEPSLARQASTTEYLPGMLHTASPAGLLPAYSSWSLLCVGPSSLYSHNVGLVESLQPGFLPHTNYLLPWDCSVKLEGVAAWRAAQAAARGRGKPPQQHLTVKIFLGYEYECPRSHRFMMSSPDTITSGGGNARDHNQSGEQLANSSMPVYVTCACRNHVAALARLHVVTPKAPVHVTLQPKVQPVAGGPIFTPTPTGSPGIKLSGAAYWVLRFPYMFASERGVLPRPAQLPLAPSGSVLAPMFGLVE